MCIQEYETSIRQKVRCNTINSQDDWSLRLNEYLNTKDSGRVHRQSPWVGKGRIASRERVGPGLDRDPPEGERGVAPSIEAWTRSRTGAMLLSTQ